MLYLLLYLVYEYTLCRFLLLVPTAKQMINYRSNLSKHHILCRKHFDLCFHIPCHQFRLFRRHIRPIYVLPSLRSAGFSFTPKMNDIQKCEKTFGNDDIVTGELKNKARLSRVSFGDSFKSRYRKFAWLSRVQRTKCVLSLLCGITLFVTYDVAKHC